MAQQQKPITPGDFRITECSIQTFGGQIYDINDKWVQVDIFESIYAPSLELILTIQDGVGMLETLPIIGEEKIFMTMYTGSDPTRATRMIFHTYKIEEIKDTAMSASTYRIRCCSPESVLNTRLRVYNSYGSLPYSEMAKQIYQEYFTLELNKSLSPVYKKNFNIEDTKGGYVIAFPGMNPFDALSMIARRSITRVDNTIPGSLFFFWETLHGHYFRSVETIMKRYQEHVEDGLLDDIPKFLVRPKNLQDPDNPNSGRNEKDFYTIDHFEHENYFDTLKNMQEGMYSRKLVGHNLIDMVVEQHEYFYDRDGYSQGHLKKDSILASSASMGLAPSGAEKKGAQHNKFAHVEYFPLNGSAFYNNAGKWKLNRGSQIEQLQSMVLNVTIPGDDRIEAGTCITLELPSRVPRTPTNKEVLRSGGFLVTRVQHNFRGGDYKMVLEVVKDSYEVELNKIITVPNHMQQLHPITLKPLAANESFTPKSVPGRAKDSASEDNDTDPDFYAVYSNVGKNDQVPTGPRVPEKVSSDQRIQETL